MWICIFSFSNTIAYIVDNQYNIMASVTRDELKSVFVDMCMIFKDNVDLSTNLEGKLKVMTDFYNMFEEYYSQYYIENDLVDLKDIDMSNVINAYQDVVNYKNIDIENITETDCELYFDVFDKYILEYIPLVANLTNI